MDFQNRQYDPQIGRFLSVDPLAGLDYQWSPYAAMGNNPAMMVDPLGVKGNNVKSIQGNPTAREYPGTEYKGVLFFTEKNPVRGIDGAMLMNYFATGSFTTIMGEQSNQGEGETQNGDMSKGEEKTGTMTFGDFVPGTYEDYLKQEVSQSDALMATNLAPQREETEAPRRGLAVMYDMAEFFANLTPILNMMNAGAITTGKNIYGQEAGPVNLLEAAGPPVGRIGKAS